MKIAIIGAGGHAKVVLDALSLMKSFPVSATCLIDPAKAGHRFAGLPVLASARELKPASFIVAIGDNARRKRCFEEMLLLGWQPINAVHPSAIIARQVALGRGTFIGPNVVINPDAQIGDNVIVNSAAVVEHDCRIGSHSHVAPGSALGGGVQVGEGALVGIGSTVCPLGVVGNWSVLGAGAVLLERLDEGATGIGVPARVKRGKEE